MNQTEQITRHSVVLIDSGISLYEFSFEPIQREAMKRFISSYENSSGVISEIDLYQLKSELNKNFNRSWDLYIIDKQGMVKCSTFIPDIGLDFSKYPEFFNNLNLIRTSDEYVQDRIVKGFFKDGPYRKFAYQGTPDHEYVLEISQNFERFYPDETETSYRELLDNLPLLNPDIMSAELYNSKIEQLHPNSNESESKSVPSVVYDKVLETFSCKGRISEYDSETGQITTYLFLPVPDKKSPSSAMMNIVARITYSTLSKEKALFAITLIYLGILFATIIIVILGIYRVYQYFAGPVRCLIEDLNKIAEGDLEHDIRETKVTELQKIESAIHSLVDNFKITIKKLKAREDELNKELVYHKAAEENIRSLLNEIQNKKREVMESEERYRNVVETQEELICRFKPDKTNIFVNEAFYRFFGCTDKDLIGMSLKLVIPDDNLNQILSGYSSLSLKNPFILYESATSLKNGDIKQVQWRVQAFFDENEEIIELQAVGRDVTELKRLQDTLQSLNLNLEKEIENRTRELEASLEELDAFAYSVSHDLRAPLRAIDGFSHLLEERISDYLDNQSRELIIRIYQGIDTMDRLIKDLLRFSRTARQPIQSIDIDVGTLVKEVIAELSSQFFGKNILITVNELEPAIGDPGLIRQVWHNLLSNAIKFSKENTPPVITIGSFKKKEEVIYYIRDQGIGFDMKYADTIFDVFSRLSPSQTTEGTGVGLALVRRIILRHQGRVWVESGQDIGTTFFFTLKGNNG